MLLCPFSELPALPYCFSDFLLLFYCLDTSVCLPFDCLLIALWWSFWGLGFTTECLSRLAYAWIASTVLLPFECWLKYDALNMLRLMLVCPFLRPMMKKFWGSLFGCIWIRLVCELNGTGFWLWPLEVLCRLTGLWLSSCSLSFNCRLWAFYLLQAGLRSLAYISYVCVFEGFKLEVLQVLILDSGLRLSWICSPPPLTVLCLVLYIFFLPA